MLYSGVRSGSLTAVSFYFSFPPGSHMVLQDLNLRRITGIRCNTFSIPPYFWQLLLPSLISERDMDTMAEKDKDEAVNELNGNSVGYLGYQKWKTA